jgi:hypothetical protein
MADVLGVITYDTLRATAGMSVTDVSDEQIESLNLDLELEINLEGWIPEFQDILDEVWVEPKSGALQFVRKRLLAYTKYYSAALLCKGASGLMLRKLSDGENIAERFAGVRPEELTDQYMTKAAEFKAMILDYLEPEFLEGSQFFGVVKPNYDPVVG